MIIVADKILVRLVRFGIFSADSSSQGSGTDWVHSCLVLCDALRLVGASIDQAQPNATDICLVQRENDVLVV